MIGIGHKKGGLYVLNKFKESIVVASSVDLSSFQLSSSFILFLWHSRSSYVFASRLNFLVFIGVLGTLDNRDIFNYSGCKLAKFSALPFNKSISSSLAPFDLVHSNVRNLLLYPLKEVLDIMSLLF